MDLSSWLAGVEHGIFGHSLKDRIEWGRPVLGKRSKRRHLLLFLHPVPNFFPLMSAAGQYTGIVPYCALHLHNRTTGREIEQN